jgi:isochorismate pyruvate lyase
LALERLLTFILQFAASRTRRPPSEKVSLLSKDRHPWARTAGASPARLPLHQGCGANCEGATWPLGPEKSISTVFKAPLQKATMTENRISPAECQTMAEVRHGIDTLDEQIVTLIGERFRYMDAAARIKPERGHVRDETRKAQVIAHARAAAGRENVPDAAIAELYEQLIEASIAYELVEWDRLEAEAVSPASARAR